MTVFLGFEYLFISSSDKGFLGLLNFVLLLAAMSQWVKEQTI